MNVHEQAALFEAWSAWRRIAAKRYRNYNVRLSFSIFASEVS